MRLVLLLVSSTPDNKAKSLDILDVAKAFLQEDLPHTEGNEFVLCSTHNTGLFRNGDANAEDASSVTIFIYPWGDMQDLLRHPSYVPASSFLFDFKSYQQEQCAKESDAAGQVILYGDVVTSTQTILEKNWSITQRLPHGLIFLTSHQTHGKGRMGNDWVSASGCLQFTLIWDVDPTSFPTKKGKGSLTSLYQYYAALTMVEAILSIPQYESLPVKIKWPNDIYCLVDDETGAPHTGRKKIGGVLVQANYISDNQTRLLIGIGINTANPKPTYCLNELALHAQLPPTSREAVMKRFCELFPRLSYEWSRDFDKFQQDYKNRWIHYQQRVYLQHENMHVNIVGLCSDGYLLARKCDDDAREQDRENENGVKEELITMQPDMYSFDLEKCTILPKKR